MDVAIDSTGIQRVQHGDRALTLRQAQELYGVPAHRLRLFRLAGLIDGFRLGRSVFLSERSLVDFLERNRESAEPVAT